MFASPVLILDEALKGLDSENVERAMGVIRSVANNKLVLVSEHHALNGYFDQIVAV